MAAPEPIYMTDAELFRVKPRFRAIMRNFDPIEQLCTLLDSTRRITDAVAILNQSSRYSSMTFDAYVTLDDCTGGDMDIFFLFVDNVSINSTRDIWSNYSLTFDKDFRNMTYFQTKLWQAEPSAVYLSLFSNSKISTSSAAINNASVSACQSGYDRGFRIGDCNIDDVFTISIYFQEARNLGGEGWKELFRRLWRFHVLAKHPMDVAYLLNSGYSSASQMATAQRDTFVSTMTQLGMPAETAVGIHEYALTIELRNEHAWSAMLTSKSNWAPATIASSTPTADYGATPVVDAAPKQVINYSNLFGNVSINVCEDCSSVTGPIAYFVELLRMLKTTPSQPTVPTSDTLLDKLLSRRPDLPTLQLSCANVNTMLPHIDIANEVMESFISNLSSASSADVVSIQASNTTGKTSSQGLTERPQSTNFNVYKTIIASQVFPQSIFPYDQAIDTMRAYMQAFGSSRGEVMSIFGSRYRLNPDSGSTGPTAYKQAASVIKNAQAAESLGLYPGDVIGISGSSIFPLTYYTQTGEISLTVDDYNRRIGLLKAAQYWGFIGGDDLTDEYSMTGETSGVGLVTQVLLPRASITLQDLLDVLRTRYLGGRLALENNGNTPLFNGDLSDLRLRHPLEGGGTASMAMLTIEDCMALQVFLRIWRKSPFSLQDTDLALSYFWDRTTTYPRISSDAIAALAGLRQLINMTGLTIETLGPFYGVMDTYGSNSIYVKLFLQGDADKADAVFGKGTDGRYLSDSSRKLSDNQFSVAAALGIQTPDWNLILKAGNITKDVLDLDSVTKIYRVFQFCKLVDIPVSMYSAFISFLGKGETPFRSPQATVDIIRRWRRCLELGLSMRQLLHMTGRDLFYAIPNPDYEVSRKKSLSFLTSLVSALISLEKNVPAAEAINVGNSTASDVTRISSLCFDPETAPQVKDFIEGS